MKTTESKEPWFPERALIGGALLVGGLTMFSQCGDPGNSSGLKGSGTSTEQANKPTPEAEIDKLKGILRTLLDQNKNSEGVQLEWDENRNTTPENYNLMAALGDCVEKLRPGTECITQFKGGIQAFRSSVPTILLCFPGQSEDAEASIFAPVRVHSFTGRNDGSDLIIDTPHIAHWDLLLPLEERIEEKTRTDVQAHLNTACNAITDVLDQELTTEEAIDERWGDYWTDYALSLNSVLETTHTLQAHLDDFDVENSGVNQGFLMVEPAPGASIRVTTAFYDPISGFNFPSSYEDVLSVPIISMQIVDTNQEYTRFESFEDPEEALDFILSYRE